LLRSPVVSRARRAAATAFRRSSSAAPPNKIMYAGARG
jgi:hypothetical protein